MLEDDGGFMDVDASGLGRGSELVWRLNDGGGLGYGDGGAS